MPKFQNTKKQKNAILKKVLKRAHQNYEKSVQKREEVEMKNILEDDIKSIS